MANQVGFRCLACGITIVTTTSDTLKGSFYANPMVEQLTVSDEDRLQFPEYYGENICESATRMHSLPLTNFCQGPTKTKGE